VARVDCIVDMFGVDSWIISYAATLELNVLNTTKAYGTAYRGV